MLYKEPNPVYDRVGFWHYDILLMPSDVFWSEPLGTKVLQQVDIQELAEVGVSCWAIVASIASERLLPNSSEATNISLAVHLFPFAQ